MDFNPEFISRMIPKLEWSALVQAAQQVSVILYSVCKLTNLLRYTTVYNNIFCIVCIYMYVQNYFEINRNLKIFGNCLVVSSLNQING